jgi:DnaJ-class molecular chaperone
VSAISCPACSGDGEVRACYDHGPECFDHERDDFWLCRTCGGDGEIASPSSSESLPDAEKGSS